jgi:predicted naringenin-chalcone synthase
MNEPAPTLLLGLGTALPAHSSSQEVALDFTLNVLRASLPEPAAKHAANLARRIHGSSGIVTRHSVLEDFRRTDAREFEFFPPRWDLEPFPTTRARMELFEAESVPLAGQAAVSALTHANVAPQDVTHLVISSCTGLFAPGPDVLLLERLGLSPHVQRLTIGFMGCYAGFNGLRVADSIVRADPRAVVLQVCVELCTIHYQKRPDPELLVANCIFADGASGAVYAHRDSGRPGIAAVAASRSSLATDSLDQMAWRIGDYGFEMRLSAEVPKTLRQAAPAFADALADSAGWSRRDVRHWALHPGGRRILEDLQTALELEPEQVEPGFAVLREVGNVSSGTIFFVLEKALAQAASAGSTPGPLLALGFGPGLTIEGAALWLTNS